MRDKKETERLADELMDIDIPNYKPSNNHVTVFENGK